MFKLKEENVVAKIALQAALQEKDSVDKALETIKGDMGKVGTLKLESSFLFV